MSAPGTTSPPAAPPAPGGVLAPILAASQARAAALADRRALLEAQARAAPPPRGFAAALAGARAAGRFGLIAEIKKRSPSAGLIRASFAPADHARAYAAAGAACLSVLTEPDWFDGALAHLAEARAACALPALRKDFLVDPVQVVEARAHGADAVLLIVAALDDATLAALAAEAARWGMDALVEVHDATELERAARLGARLIGINNRNLDTLVTDTATAHRLAALAPPGALLVAESGLKTRADLEAAAAHGISCLLVGESLMAQADLEAATRRLLHG
jgi:indole-3-glycerol phosphate synthase